MMNLSRKAAAAAAFTIALGGSIAVSPAILDSALALDAKSSGDGQQPHMRLPSDMIDARIAYLRTALKITDAQAKPWNAFADVLRKQAKERDAMVTAHRAYRDAKFTVVDRLEKRQKWLTRAASDTAELLTAVQPLYASLSEDQKQTADEFLVHGGHWGGEHGGGHWGRPGGMGHDRPQPGPVKPE